MCVAPGAPVLNVLKGAWLGGWGVSIIAASLRKGENLLREKQTAVTRRLGSWDGRLAGFGPGMIEELCPSEFSIFIIGDGRWHFNALAREGNNY